MNGKKIKDLVKEGYGRIAREGGSCCPSADSCCPDITPDSRSERSSFYDAEDTGAAPRSADLGLGCGNPLASSSLKNGEIVLDLGSGAGFDCFLAASRVGPEGRVIGVDMTPGMVARARENARKGPYANVEFLLSDIEALPLPDASVDAVISNCVINLSPGKSRVFAEAFRVLKPGGRLNVSDIVLGEDLPEEIARSAQAYLGCIAGALRKEAFLESVKAAGFIQVKVEEEREFRPALSIFHQKERKDGGIEEEAVPCMLSILVSAHKPMRPTAMK